jgi:hypothetical protein
LSETRLGVLRLRILRLSILRRRVLGLCEAWLGELRLLKLRLSELWLRELRLGEVWLSILQLLKHWLLIVRGARKRQRCKKGALQNPHGNHPQSASQGYLIRKVRSNAPAIADTLLAQPH